MMRFKVKKMDLRSDHPLRRLFRHALQFGVKEQRPESKEVVEYIEDQILCGFMDTDYLYRIRDAKGKRLEDIADMLAEGNVLLNAQSFEREFEVHKHIGDYTLFMLGMFPSALMRRKGKEFIMGQILVPGASLFDHYILQGQRSYRIASEFAYGELFRELSKNFLLYKDILELVRIYLESIRNKEYLKAKEIIGGTE
jgi:hypothetical protein